MSGQATGTDGTGTDDRPGMDDPRWEPGMPVLDRQGIPEPSPPPASGPGVRGNAASAPSALPPSLAGQPPRSVPEVRPTPLQRHYVNLSVVVLLAGVVAITALELGTPLGAPIVKIPVLIGAPILVLTTADASLRIWRSAWAWMPVDRGRGFFRLAWLLVTLIGLAGLVAGSLLVIGA